MDKKFSPELEALKEEFDFLNKKIGELEWEIATIFYGKKAVLEDEIDLLYEQFDNYGVNKKILIGKIENEVKEANKSKRN